MEKYSGLVKIAVASYFAVPFVLTHEIYKHAVDNGTNPVDSAIFWGILETLATLSPAVAAAWVVSDEYKLQAFVGTLIASRIAIGFTIMWGAQALNKND